MNTQDAIELLGIAPEDDERGSRENILGNDQPFSSGLIE